MFNRKTVLILGAGASAEFNMPVGSQLMSQIADLVQFKSKHSDPHFRGQIFSYFGHERRAALAAAGSRLSSLISRFDSMDEVLHFLSGEAEAIQLGKVAIAYQILKAERNSVIYGMLLNNAEAIKQCDSTWASWFLRIAISAARRQDYKKLFQNVTVVDFNYDRIFPQYLHSALQRLYGFTEEESTAALGGLRILHPYGVLGPLEWQASEEAIPFADEEANLLAIAGRIRTFTEERNAPEMNEIKSAVADGRVFLVLGFGFHGQNIEILSVGRAQLGIPCFMTVAGINPHNHNAVALKMQNAIQAFQLPQYLAEQARSLMDQLRTSISLSVA